MIFFSLADEKAFDVYIFFSLFQVGNMLVIIGIFFGVS